MSTLPTALSELQIRLWVILADGEWHDAHEVVDTLARAVPLGPAYRYTEHARERNSQRRHGAVQPRTYEPDPVTIAKSGQRGIALRLVTSSAKAGRIELDPPELTRGHWQHRAAIRTRWIGPALGVTIDSSDGRLRELADLHRPDEDGRCAECGTPWECRSSQIIRRLPDPTTPISDEPLPTASDGSP
jgi:hypothetical protein